MNKFVVSLVFFCLSYVCFSQSFKGKIVDTLNNSPLNQVSIIFVNTGTKQFSAMDGSFEILKEGLYRFEKNGYISKEIKLFLGNTYIIQLKNDNSQLNEIVVNAYHIPETYIKSTSAISLITSKDIQKSHHIDFAPVLNRTPGVFMQNGVLNTNRITIRGIGSRNLFGTSKIRAYFKDIPLTNGSGETTIEDFELATISRFEIVKGATSSIYGAGLGGAIHLKPQSAYLKQSSFNTELSIGSFGLQKSIASINLGNKKNNLRAVYSHTQSDGYRNNNNYNRQTFTITSNHYIDKKNELTVLGSFVDLKAFIPSSLNITDFIENPKSAAFTWQRAQGFEDSKRGILGITWHHNYQDNLEHITSIFTSFRNAFEPRPFNILDENSFAYGLRTRLLGTTKYINTNIKWTVGTELFKDTYTYNTFANLYRDFPPETGSVQGEKLSNFKEKRNYYNLFSEANVELTKKTTVSLGVNLNQTAYNLEDRFPISDDNPDQSGTFKFKTIISPKFGLSYLLTDNISIFSSLSHGFSPLSLNETLMPDGQINMNLQPETGWNFEMGTKGSVFKNKLQFSASLYQLNIKNLLVARRTAEDEFIGINAGKTQHNGLEAFLQYQVIKTKKINLSCFTNYTLNNFSFKEFIDDTDDFSGNDLTGVPSEIFNAGIDVSSNIGFYGNINFQHVGSMPITDSNILYSDDYNLTNLKLGYQKNLNKNLKINVFLGINNILDVHYASQVLINAPSFGGNAPRYYYPGNPVNYFSGLNLNYIL